MKDRLAVVGVVVVGLALLCAWGSMWLYAFACPPIPGGMRGVSSGSCGGGVKKGRWKKSKRSKIKTGKRIK